MAIPAFGPTWHRLNQQQRRVAATVLQRGVARRATFPELVASMATGRVEANFGNPRGGHGSSQGWRQETYESYPDVNRRDVAAAADRFFSETAQNRRAYAHFGRLAQSVQRSAYPGRYAQHGAEAKALVREFLAAQGGGGGGGGVQVPGTTATATVTPGQVPSPDLGPIFDLASAMRQREQQSQLPVSTPAPPSFTATRALPMAGNLAAALPSMPPAPRGGLDIEGLLAEAVANRPEVAAPPQTASATAPGVSVPGAGGVAGGGGRTALRGGYSGTQGLVDGVATPIARQMIGRVGSHKRTPAENAEAGGDPDSDHLTTNTNAFARDYPTSGRTGIHLANRIAKAYGVKFVPNSYSSGGTIRTPDGRRVRIQILYGGGIDHADHVHVGARVVG